MYRRSITLVLGAVLLAAASLNVRAPAQESRQSAFANSAEKVLRGFNQPGVNYLLLDIRENAFLVQNWPAADRRVPVGSLVKPFTALADAESHEYKFPEYTCTGAATCWLPRGHGHLDLTRATAFSCNSYFTQLASQTTAVQVANITKRFGLSGPPVEASPAEMIGRYGTWRESPKTLALAYAELLRRRTQPGVRELVAGMAVAAHSGTAAEIAREASGIAVLAKTGTAPCTRAVRAPGDGWVIVAWPAEAPHYLLLVREHGKPGALAADLAGRMLRQLEPRR